MNNLSRWLPSYSPALVGGAIASAITYGLAKLGIVVVPADVAAFVVPIVGFVVATIIQKPGGPKPVAPNPVAGIVGDEVERLLLESPPALQHVIQVVMTDLFAQKPPEVPPTA